MESLFWFLKHQARKTTPPFYTRSIRLHFRILIYFVFLPQDLETGWCWLSLAPSIFRAIFSRWPLKQYCCCSCCHANKHAKQRHPHATHTSIGHVSRNRKISWHFYGSKFRCAIHSADRWWSWLHFDDPRMNPRPKNIFEIVTWWPSGSRIMEFSCHCQKTRFTVFFFNFFLFSNSWWLLQRNMMFTMLHGLLIHSIPRLNTLRKFYVRVSLLVLVCLLHCSYDIMIVVASALTLVIPILPGDGWEVVVTGRGDLLSCAKFRASKNFQELVLESTDKTCEEYLTSTIAIDQNFVRIDAMKQIC